jgi:hypothetical protein
MYSEINSKYCFEQSLSIMFFVPFGDRTEVVGKHSRKEPFEQLVNSCSEHLPMSARPLQNARDSIHNSDLRIRINKFLIRNIGVAEL